MTTTEVPVRLRDDTLAGPQQYSTARVDGDLAQLFAYSRQWAVSRTKTPSDLTFSSMLAAMVASKQPLCLWLRRYFDGLGVPSDEITGGKTFTDTSLLGDRDADHQYLATTFSFRQALTKAEELRDLISPEQPVAVRHFMAAYAVCEPYHPQDFRKYRIDRRDWCFDLSDEIGRRFPSEAAKWSSLYTAMAPALLQLAFDNDAPDGRDRLHLRREVDTFARLIAARSTATPLSIGVFGAWGSGKSFFMRRTRESVAKLAAAATIEGRESPFHSRIAQVEFNAWHYSEKALIASLVDHIFRNLRFDELDEDQVTLARRGKELMLLLENAQRSSTTADLALGDAEENARLAELNLLKVQEHLPEAVRMANTRLAAVEHEASNVRNELSRTTAERDAAVHRSQVVTSAATWLRSISDTSTLSSVDDVTSSLLSLASEVADVRKRRRSIAIGIVLLVFTAGFAAVARTQAWAAILSTLTAVTAFATVAGSWVAKLRKLSTNGELFTSNLQKARRLAAEEANAKFAGRIEELQAEVQAKDAAVEAARSDLDAAADIHHATEQLAHCRDELVVARNVQSRARGEAERLAANLSQLSIDHLLQEFLDDRQGANTYREQLGIFSQVRNDFERLSKLIAESSADYYEKGKPPPTLSRIVLYIDDLDRCPEDKVIEVLRAVHLLLAFPLFVCVVAVDPRWLTRCLSNAPGITRAGLHDAFATKPDGTTDDPGSLLESQFGKPADAADYIEKIFQVPMWLRPIPQDKRPGLLRSWLENTDATPTAALGPMTDEELVFLTELAPYLDGKPRTLKRLANSYRLVKNSLSDVTFATFIEDRYAVEDGLASEGPVGPRWPYRVCMTQLAVLNRDRERAIAMIDSLDNSTEAAVGDWLERLATDQRELADFLYVALDPVDRLSLTEFRAWLERTRRYSFYL